ncbi:hypothetical protein [Caudoviricetes sp.]|nr:hypothetical protein [Caudoviricetes sp.]
MQKLNILMERQSGKIERHKEDIDTLKEEMKKIAILHIECPARKKADAHGIVWKDVAALTGLVGAIIALLKSFNVIK